MVNDEDDMILQHCTALLIRKHDIGLLDKTSEGSDSVVNVVPILLGLVVYVHTFFIARLQKEAGEIYKRR